MQKGLLAELSRKEQTVAVLEADAILEQKLIDLRTAPAEHFGFRASMERIATRGATV